MGKYSLDRDGDRLHCWWRTVGVALLQSQGGKPPRSGIFWFRIPDMDTGQLLDFFQGRRRGAGQSSRTVELRHKKPDHGKAYLDSLSFRGHRGRIYDGYTGSPAPSNVEAISKKFFRPIRRRRASIGVDTSSQVLAIREYVPQGDFLGAPKG